MTTLYYNIIDLLGAIMKKALVALFIIFSVFVYAEKTYYFFDADANKTNFVQALILYDQKKYDGVRTTTKDMDGNKVVIYAVGLSSKNTQYRFFFVDESILIRVSDFASREMPSYTIPTKELGTKLYVADLGITFVMGSYKKTHPSDIELAKWPGEDDVTCMDDDNIGK